MGQTFSNGDVKTQLELKKIDLEIARVKADRDKIVAHAKLEIAKINARIHIVTGVHWVYSTFGIADATKQGIFFSALATSMGYGIQKLYQAKNLEFWEAAKTEAAKDEYAHRAGFRNCMPDKLVLKSKGYMGLFGFPLAMIVYLILTKTHPAYVANKAVIENMATKNDKETIMVTTNNKMA